jgi:hypothetical protein
VEGRARRRGWCLVGSRLGPVVGIFIGAFIANRNHGATGSQTTKSGREVGPALSTYSTIICFDGILLTFTHIL